MEDGTLKPTTLGTPQGGVISPLLANIVLDVLDQELTKHGYVFVRYADDFLVLTRSNPDMEKAQAIVQNVIEKELKLTLEPDKTKITSFREGFDFLGFSFSLNSVTMRAKSVEKLKDNIRGLTIRSQNFSSAVVVNLNRVIRGVANYYATDFSTVKEQFRKLDKMIRRRLRCLKKKRISVKDNWRIRNNYFERKGLVSLCSLMTKN